MFNNGLAQLLSEEFHKKIKGRLKRFGFTVEVLDNDESGKRPDYFVYKANDRVNGYIVECKYIASPGMTEDKKCHASLLDDEITEHGPFCNNTYYEKAQSRIEDATIQYKSLVRDNPFYADKPFLVAMEFEFFSDCFDMIQRDMFGIKEVSGIIRLVSNIEKKEFLHKLPTDELKDIIHGKIKKKLPPDEVQFKVVLNPKAQNPFDAYCLKNPLIQ